MARHLRRFLPAAWIIATIMIPLLGGCKDDSPADPDGGTPADPMPDFTLQDVNHNSSTFDVILDQDNRQAGVFNLTTDDLSVPANYDALKSLLLEVALDQAGTLGVPPSRAKG